MWRCRRSALRRSEEMGTLGRLLWGPKHLPKPYPKGSFWLACFGRLKKSRFLRYCKQACISSFRLFFCAFHARGHALRDRPAVIVGWLRLRGDAVFPAGKTSGFSRSGVIPLPLVSPQRNGVTIAQANTAAVRTATPSGFAKKTEKGLGSRGRACSQIGFQTLFQSDCRDLIAANYHARLVSLVLSLTQRKYRPPRSL